MNNGSYLKKTGILGGTFNPIHVGHLVLAQNAMEYCGLDKVLFIPTGCSYLKDPKEVADTAHRVNMTRMAIKDNMCFELSTIESDREGNSYTYETLGILRRENPDTRYYYIVGADTLMYMEKWKEPGKIFEACTVVCAMRDDIGRDVLEEKASYLEERFKADVILMDIPEIEVSSSMIRKLLTDGKSCRYYLNDEVRQYISYHALYKKS